MSTTLYRKYRPQVFEDLIDQEIIKQTLQNEIKSGHIAHAYLFSGPRGLGKTTTARLLAKAVNCQNRKSNDFEPCNTCDSCQAIINNRSLDLIEVDAASNRGINEIRQLKEHIGFTPAGSNYRVFIIDEVHMLTTEAFNALLKTLEEPPAHAVFILATTELHKVPDTVISRCQTFTFRRVDEQHLALRLEKIANAEGIKVDEAVLAQIAHLSGGFIRDAESMLGQLLSLGEKRITKDIAKLVLPTSNIDYVVKFLGFLQAAQVAEALQYINSLSDQGADLEYFSKELLEALRQLLIGEYVTAEYVDDHLRDIQGSFGVKRLLQLISLVNNALREIKRAEIPQLPLELVVVEFLQTENEQVVKIENNSDKNNKDDNDSTTSSHSGLACPVTKFFGDPESSNSTKPVKDLKTGKVNLSLIKKKWSDVVEVSSQYNHSLPLTLRVAHPLSYGEISDDTLELGFEYELHVTRLNNPETKVRLANILKDLLGVDLKISSRLLTDEEKESIHKAVDKEEAKQEEKLVSDALEAFGGQVVGE